MRHRWLRLRVAWYRLRCPHTNKVNGRDTYRDPEEGRIYVRVFCANHRCYKLLGAKTVGYDDGIML